MSLFPLMIKQRIAALVVGIGSIGRRHLTNLHLLGVTECAFADPNASPDLVTTLVAETGARAFGDFEAALDAFSPTVVFICTPSKLHIPQALVAARHGAHIFIEKPLSHTLDGIDALEQEVCSRGLIAAVGCNMRFHPGILKIRELLAAGTIGNPISVRYHSASFLPRWHPNGDYRKSYSADPIQGGAILDCIHEIDLALWQFGAARLVGSAVLPASTLGLTVDGLAEILLRHDSSVLTSMNLNFVERQNRRSCLVIGSEGTINWDDGRGVVELIHADGRLETVLTTPAHFERDNAMFLEEMKAFLAAIGGGENPLASLAEGRAALEIALEAKRRGS